jgi:hypothetical protein
LVRSRIGWAWAASLLAAMATGIGLMLFSERRTGITSDYSPIWSFLVPGIVVSVLLFLGCSEMEDHETVARPQPQAAGAVLVFIAVASCTLTLSLFTPDTTVFVDHGPAELVRNAFVVLGVGYLTVILAGWRLAPYVTGMVTLALPTAFAVTRSESALFLAFRMAEGSFEAAAAVLAAAVLGTLATLRTIAV